MSEKTIAGFYGDDHDRLDAIFKEFQRLKKTDLAAARIHFADFRESLLRHIRWEEEVLFPVFEEKSGMSDCGPTKVMRMEHKEIKEAVEGIGRGLKNDKPQTESDEEALLCVLGDHNVKEERVLYPALDQMTDGREKDEIFRKMEAFGAAAADLPKG